MPNRSRGITLIELLVVMTIIGILLTFTGPPISAGLDNLLLKTTGQRALSAFKMAQNSARSSGQRVFAVYGPGGLQFFRGAQVYQTVAVPSGVTMTGSEGTVNFVFLESGRIIGPDTLELTNSRGRRLRLSVDHARGTVKLVKEGGGG